MHSDFLLPQKDFSDWLRDIRKVSSNYAVHGTDNEITTVLWGAAEEFDEFTSLVDVDPKSKEFTEKLVEEYGDFVNYCMQGSYLLYRDSREKLFRDESIGDRIDAIAMSFFAATNRVYLNDYGDGFKKHYRAEARIAMAEFKGNCKRLYRGDAKDRDDGNRFWYHSQAQISLLRAYETTCAIFSGYNIPLKTVAAFNVSKLNGRVERGTLTGHGRR